MTWWQQKLNVQLVGAVEWMGFGRSESSDGKWTVFSILYLSPLNAHLNGFFQFLPLLQCKNNTQKRRRFYAFESIFTFHCCALQTFFFSQLITMMRHIFSLQRLQIISVNERNEKFAPFLQSSLVWVASNWRHWLNPQYWTMSRSSIAQ